jgi:hypothetical protein
MVGRIDRYLSENSVITIDFIADYPEWRRSCRVKRHLTK